MRKARLTSRQVISAILAGILGHFLFTLGWLGLGVMLLGGVLTGVLSGVMGGLGELFATETLENLAGGRRALAAIFGVLAIGAAVLVLLSILVSWLILRVGKVRKAGATTWMSLLISALIALPLLILYAAIAGNTADGQPRFTVVALIGTAVAGALIWLWMTWAFRGPAPEIEMPASAAAGAAPRSAAVTSVPPPVGAEPAAGPEPVAAEPVAKKETAKK